MKRKHKKEIIPPRPDLRWFYPHGPNGPAILQYLVRVEQSNPTNIWWEWHDVPQVISTANYNRNMCDPSERRTIKTK